MIKHSIANAVLDEALRSGGDFSELYMQDTETNSLSMVNGVVEDAKYQRKAGAGVRVLKGTRSAYAYTADTSEEALIATARAAAAAIDGVKEFESKSFEVMRDGRIAPRIPFSEIGNDRRIALLRDGTKAAKAYSDEITQVVASYMDCDHRIMVCNSNGVWAEDRRPRARVYVQTVAMANGEAQTGSVSPGLGMGFETFERINMEDVGRESAKSLSPCCTLPNARQAQSLSLSTAALAALFSMKLVFTDLKPPALPRAIPCSAESLANR